MINVRDKNSILHDDPIYQTHILFLFHHHISSYFQKTLYLQDQEILTKRCKCTHVNIIVNNNKYYQYIHRRNICSL